MDVVNVLQHTRLNLLALTRNVKGRRFYRVSFEEVFQESDLGRCSGGKQDHDFLATCGAVHNVA